MAAMTDRKLFAPPPNPETAPFWAGTAQDKLLLRWCLTCERTHWFPRAVCPHCASMDGEWREASGLGAIHSFSTMERAEPPFVVAMVTLDEGPTMTTNLVDCDSDSLAIGQRVRVVFKATEDGGKLPMFRPAEQNSNQDTERPA